MVEIAGERTLAPSCCRSVTAGMEVQASSERAVKSQKMVLELLLSDMPEAGYKWNEADESLQHGELSDWAARMKVTVRPELKALRREQPKADLSHPAMAVNLDACIQCNRCVRACREEQVNDVIGFALRGAHSDIVFDLNDPMGDSTCVACGECVQACPTGALMPKTQIGSQIVDKKVDSVCPFCGVGCLLTYNVKDNTIVSVDGRDGPANHSRLCVKGRFGFDYAHSPQRLTVPLIRKAGVAKDPQALQHLNRDTADWSEVFREATWDEALALSTGALKNLRDTKGKKSLAGFGSAKGSNEEAYLFQKLVRTGFGSNNVDHCTRLCHASSVAALLEGVGSAAVSNQVHDVENAGPDFHHRLEPDGQPSGGGDLDEERRQKGRQDRAGRPARHRHRQTRLAHAAVQGRHRRGDAQCADLHGDRRGAGRRGVHQPAGQQLRSVEGKRQGLQPRGHGADLRHSGRHAARGGA